MRKLAVFSLVLALALAGAVTTVSDTTEDANGGISTHSDLWFPEAEGN